MIVSTLMRRLIRRGRLTIIAANGETATFGALPGEAVTIALSDPAFGRKFLRDPSLAIGEAYMDRTSCN